MRPPRFPIPGKNPSGKGQAPGQAWLGSMAQRPVPGGPGEESRLRGTASRGEEAVGTGPRWAEPRCQIAATSSSRPTPGTGHPRARRHRGPWGTPHAPHRHHHPPLLVPLGLGDVPPASYRPHAWHAHVCTPVCSTHTCTRVLPALGAALPAAPGTPVHTHVHPPKVIAHRLWHIPSTPKPLSLCARRTHLTHAMCPLSLGPWGHACCPSPAPCRGQSPPARGSTPVHPLFSERSRAQLGEAKQSRAPPSPSMSPGTPCPPAPAPSRVHLWLGPGD